MGTQEEQQMGVWSGSLDPETTRKPYYWYWFYLLLLDNQVLLLFRCLLGSWLTLAKPI